MTDRPSPTAVLREGPRALSDEQVREIEESNLADVLKVDIDDVIEYVHRTSSGCPGYLDCTGGTSSSAGTSTTWTSART